MLATCKKISQLTVILISLLAGTVTEKRLLAGAESLSIMTNLTEKHPQLPRYQTQEDILISAAVNLTGKRVRGRNS